MWNQFVPEQINISADGIHNNTKQYNLQKKYTIKK